MKHTTRIIDINERPFRAKCGCGWEVWFKSFEQAKQASAKHYNNRTSDRYK